LGFCKVFLCFSDLGGCLCPSFFFCLSLAAGALQFCGCRCPFPFCLGFDAFQVSIDVSSPRFPGVCCLAPRSSLLQIIHTYLIMASA